MAREESSNRIAGIIVCVTNTIAVVWTTADEFDLVGATSLVERHEAVILNIWVVRFLHVHIRASAPCVQTRGADTTGPSAVLVGSCCRCFRYSGRHDNANRQENRAYHCADSVKPTHFVHCVLLLVPHTCRLKRERCERGTPDPAACYPG